MRRIVLLVLTVAAGLCLGGMTFAGASPPRELARQARALANTDPNADIGTYVTPAFSAPKAPQVCGEDGGAACTLTLRTGVCLRIAAGGTWRYQVGAWDTRSDGVALVVTATGALVVGEDGGACFFADGGACVYPKLSPLFDSQIEGWCLPPGATKLSAVTVDGGLLSVSERYP